jgi:glyoxylase-like metal-dependent hydrolase (beta-lactamase superfamily II)
MRQFRVGALSVGRIVESEAPFLEPVEMFAEATETALAPYRSWLEPRALCPVTGKLILPIQTYVVETSHHRILLDTCVGNDKSVEWHPPWHRKQGGSYLTDLATFGLAPEDIDVVLCTHLHVDHCGWHTRLADGRWVPTFPNARYVFARREYDASAESARTERNSTFEDNVVPVMEAGLGELVEMDHAIDDEVWLEPTPGHTPGHVAIHLASRGAHAIMCGDLMHSPVQCAHPEWNFIYDADQELARATRRGLLEANCETSTLVMTAHFPSPSVGYIDRSGAAFRFRDL